MTAMSADFQLKYDNHAIFIHQHVHPVLVIVATVGNTNTSFCNLDFLCLLLYVFLCVYP